MMGIQHKLILTSSGNDRSLGLEKLEAETLRIIEKQQKDREPEALHTGNEKILFIDDEESIVKMVKRILERLGYQVASRTSSYEAIEAFRATPDKYDIVITDFTMPNMTGIALSKEMLKIRPDIPIIFCTGYSNTATEEQVAREERQHRFDRTVAAPADF